MPIKTVAALLREDRDKLRKAASDRMRQRWAKPKIETKAQLAKTKTGKPITKEEAQKRAMNAHAVRSHELG